MTRSMIAQSSPSRFSIGVPVSASARRRGIRRSARCRFVRGFFASCASSSSSRSHSTRASSSTSRVATSYDVTTTSLRTGGVDERVACEARRPVVEVDHEPRREAGDLARPLLGDAHRADDERRADLGAGLLALGDEGRDRLHGLPEAHVVGEDPADPQVAEQPEPAVAALLEREEVVTHPGGRRERPEAPLVRPGEELVERCRRAGPRRARRPASSVSRPATARTSSTTPGGAAAAVSRNRSARSTSARAERVPLAAQADQRLLRGRELAQLLLA